MSCSSSVLHPSLDEKLAEGLDQDGLLKLKAVEKTVEFYKDRAVTDVTIFHKTYEEIYQFLKTKEENGVS